MSLSPNVDQSRDCSFLGTEWYGATSKFPTKCFFFFFLLVFIINRASHAQKMQKPARKFPHAAATAIPNTRVANYFRVVTCGRWRGRRRRGKRTLPARTYLKHAFPGTAPFRVSEPSLYPLLSVAPPFLCPYGKFFFVLVFFVFFLCCRLGSLENFLRVVLCATNFSCRPWQVCVAASSAWMDAAESALNGSPAFALARPPGHHATAGVGMGKKKRRNTPSTIEVAYSPR